MSKGRKRGCCNYLILLEYNMIFDSRLFSDKDYFSNFDVTNILLPCHSRVNLSFYSCINYLLKSSRAWLHVYKEP